MSFAGTPLGQGRRVDHSTFLGKTKPRQPSPQRPITTAYSYGAPPSGARSPPKLASTTGDRDNEDPSQPALARFSQLKQQRSSALNPEAWNVQDTTVQIAAAFHQAANGMNPNNSWASGSRPNATVPRSTSVEYENQSQSSHSRRLAAPPGRIPAPRSTTGARRAPVSKNHSTDHVPDSEGEDTSQNSLLRAKSPLLEGMKDMASRASFFLKPKSQTNGKDHSYDYSGEEREVQGAELLDGQTHSRRTTANAAHKRNRMSTDNRAYRPTASDIEESDDDDEDDGKTRRKKKAKAKGAAGGPLTTLPVTDYGKRKKRKSKGKNNAAGGEEGSESEEIIEPPPPPRASKPPSSRHSASRGSVPPQDHSPETSFDPTEQRLQTLPEEQDDLLDDAEEGIPHNEDAARQSKKVASRGHKPAHFRQSFSIGAALGKFVHFNLRLVAAVFHLLGRLIGTVVQLLFNRPRQWVGRLGTGPLMAWMKWLFIAATILTALYLHNPIMNLLPHWPERTPYQAPDVPAGNIAELSARLQRIESALSGLAVDIEKSRVNQDTSFRSHNEIVGRFSGFESRWQKESSKFAEAVAHSRNSAKLALQDVRHEVEIMQAQIQAQNEVQQTMRTITEHASDDEAREKLRLLEERLGSVEGGVKEALDMGKNSIKQVRIAERHCGSSDGQDVTSLITLLVDSAVSMYSKDMIGRPDFALHSSGASVIPKLTTEVLEFSPQTLSGKVQGIFSGYGYAVGRPPITALHHDLHNGYCWPFRGSQGQLGVKLAWPVIIDDVTIDHVSKEGALSLDDLNSAPREMELWGLLEGQDNIAKVDEWRAERDRQFEQRKREADERGETLVEQEEEPYPSTLPAGLYLKIAAFSYEIGAVSNIQSFSVLPEIKAMGLDFGIVVLRIRSNWGNPGHTCLYRLRVHGDKLGASHQLPALEGLD